jgi:hypothetical protein
LEKELEIVNQVGQVEGEPHQIVTTPKALTLGCCVLSKMAKTLETAETFYQYDEALDLNLTVLAFPPDPVVSTTINKLYNCGDFYSTSPLMINENPSLSLLYIILTILAAVAFVLVIDSYWPMLWSMFKTIRGIDKKLDGQQEFEMVIQNPMDKVMEKKISVEKKEVGFCATNKLLVFWIIICIVASFIAALFLAIAVVTIIEESFDTGSTEMCIELNKSTEVVTRKGKRLHNSEDVSTIQIISETENSTSLTMPCDSSLYDDLGNLWTITGPYKLECEEMRTFDYTLAVHGTRYTKCCGWPEVTDKDGLAWATKGISKGDEGRENTAYPDCNTCYRWFKHRYFCDTTPVQLQYCSYKDLGPTLISLNGQNVSSATTSLAVSPILQTPYGFWRNDTSVIVANADFMYLEGTNFNYSCVPINSPRAMTDYMFATPRTVSPLPHLVGCQVLVKVDFKVDSEAVHYCEEVNAVLDERTGGFGFITNLTDECSVKIADSADFRYHISLSSGSYRFFKDVKKIACTHTTNGYYINCSNSAVMVDLVTKSMKYDEGAEVIVTSSSDGSRTSSTSISFSDLFKNNTFNIIMIVVFIIIGIVAVIIIICLIRYLCNRQKQSQNSS